VFFVVLKTYGRERFFTRIHNKEKELFGVHDNDGGRREIKGENKRQEVYSWDDKCSILCNIDTL
jgi:hypothetical protein